LIYGKSLPNRLEAIRSVASLVRADFEILPHPMVIVLQKLVGEVGQFRTLTLFEPDVSVDRVLLDLVYQV
jgi:hypothetical protein